MELALISIIVPVFNEQKHLAECLDSLLKLDYPVHQREIIVVDNNSTDDSAQIVKNYPVRYVFAGRPGAAAARNKGAEVAKGDILAFVDADCLVYENWLDEIHRVLSDPDIDAAMGFAEGINGTLWAEFRQRLYEVGIEKEVQGSTISKVAAGTFAIRRNVFIASDGFGEDFFRAHDTEFGIRLHSQRYKVVFAPQIRVRHINPTTLQEITETRTLQGLFAYKIARKYNGVFQRKYFPEFDRWYYRYIFSENRRKDLLVLNALAFFLHHFISISIVALEKLHFLGFRESLFALFLFIFDCCFLHGKVLARLLERGSCLSPLVCRPTLMRHLEIIGCLPGDFSTRHFVVNDTNRRMTRTPF